MKKFKDFLSEEMMPFAQTEKGFVGVDNGPVRDNINIHLAAVTGRSHATPYHAMEMIRKVLAPFSIFPPQTNFLDGDSGHEVFPIKQFGDKMGMTNDGTVVVKNFSPYYIYFEYQMNDMGSFDIFCEIVEESELQEILDDIEDEMEEGETTDGDEADAEDSFDEYKAGNDLKEDYDSVRKAEAGDAKAIAKRARNPKEKKKWSKTHKDLSKDAVEGRIDEIADTARGKEAVRQVMHRADATAVDSAINPPRSKKGKREAKNAIKTIDRGIAVHKKKGGVLDSYLKRSYGLKKEETLNELHGKSKEAMKAIKKRIEKKHDAEWEATHEKRAKEKLKGSEKTKKEDKSRNDLAKRWLRADKAEKKLKESSDTPPWRMKGDKPSGESKTPDAESKSKIKKITKRLAKMGMSKKK